MFRLRTFCRMPFPNEELVEGILTDLSPTDISRVEIAMPYEPQISQVPFILKERKDCVISGVIGKKCNKNKQNAV